VGDAAETLKLRFRTHAVAWDELDAKQAREHIAVHEAGHAVVGLRHGMRLLTSTSAQILLRIRTEASSLAACASMRRRAI
jgi:hypothetical protein